MSNADAIAQSPDILKGSTSEESEQVTKKRTLLSTKQNRRKPELDYFGVLGST